MKRYHELIQARIELRREEDALFAAADGRDFTDSEAARADAIHAEFGRLNADIEREERRRERDRTTTDARPLTGGPATGVAVTAASGGFQSLGHQLLAVQRMASNTATPAERELLMRINIGGGIQAAGTGLNEATPADGGFLVQQDMASELLRNVWDTGVLSRKCRRRTVTGNGIKINRLAETSRADGSRMGGVRAYWSGEAGAYTASRPTFDQFKLELDSLRGLYYATDELLMDATALEGEVRDWYNEEFGFSLDDAIWNGTGAGVPLGILNSAALVTQAAEGGQAVDTVNAANIQKMYARMMPRLLAGAEWFINQEVWPQLFAMNQANMPIFMPGNNMAGAPFGTLLGRPINPIEHASALGDVGDIAFLNLDQYMLIEKGGVEMASSIHVQFLTGETAFRFTQRTNGSPIPKSAITPYKGASTVSPFVVLAAR